ncbi:Small-conductance mechanosensitive channel [bacterium HR19]|nr:Small-conductance mechanosensitive channel [bacterium HR19]
MEINEIILPIVLVAGGFLIGVISEKIIFGKLKKIAENSKWEGTDVIISSLQKFVTSWLTLAGLQLAFISLQLKTNILNILQKIIVILYILTISIAISNIAVGLLNLYTKKVKELIPSASIFTNLTRILIILIGILIILNFLGISITPILTALGVGGLAVALALQDTLSNLFAGLHIIMSRKIRPGDYIKLSSGEEGYVVDISWRNTMIRQLPNNLVIIPNSKLASAIVINYHLPEKDLAVLVEVGVSYDSDLEKVEKVTVEVAKEVMREVPGGVPEFEPFIRYHTFGDFSINFTVILRAREFVDQYLIKHEFIKRLHKRYNEEGIVIPYPIRTVYLSGNGKK